MRTHPARDQGAHAHVRVLPAIWLAAPAAQGALVAAAVHLSAAPRTALHLEEHLAAGVAAAAALVLGWHILWMALARIATWRRAPRLLAGAVARLVGRWGTRAARAALARHGARALAAAALIAAPLPAFAAETVPDDLLWDPAHPGPAGVAATAPAPADGSAPAGEDANEAADRGHSATAATAEPDIHVVRPGESLWAIAAARLGDAATEADVADLWPRIYARNARAIGADPNVIHPGTRLRIPGGTP